MKKNIKYFIVAILSLALFVGYFFVKPKNASAGANVGLEKVNTYENNGEHFEDYKVYLEVTDTTKINRIVGTLTLTNMTIEKFNGVTPWNVLDTTSTDNTYVFDVLTKTYQTGKNYIAKFTIKKIDYQADCNLTLSVKFSNEVLNQFKITKKAVNDNGDTITSVNEGETFNYKIMVNGVNNYVETDEVIVTDTIPSEFEIISSDATTMEGQKLTWNLGKFAKGNVTKELNVVVKAKKEGTYKNTATLTVGDKTLESSVDVKVLKPILSIEKNVDKSKISLDETFKYTITVKNTGTGSSKNTTIYDTIPSGIKVTNAKGTRNGSTFDVTITDNILNQSVGIIKSGETITITMDAVIEDYTKTGDTIKNIAILKEEGEEDKESEIDVSVLKPDLSVTKTSSVDKVNVNDEFEYTITIKNNGEGNALNVIVNDIIPSNFKILSVDGATYSGQTINANYDALKSNEEKIIKIKVKVISGNDSDVITNKVTITSKNDTPKDDTVDVTITKPKLEVTKVANVEKIKRGQSFTYTIVLTNTGTGVAKDVLLEDVIDDNFIITSVNGANYENNKVSQRYDTLAPGASKKIEIVVKVKANASLGTINNEVTVTSSNTDSTKDSTDVEVVDAILNLTKTAVGKTKVLPNTQVEYLITIKNIGTAKSEKVTIEDTIPNGLEYISANVETGNVTNTPSFSNNKMTLLIDSIDINETIVIRLKVKVNSDVANNTTIKNVVIATEDGKNPIEDEEIITIFTPKISIKKVADKDIIKRGDTFTYTITIKNESDIDLENVTLSDTIDSNFEVISINGESYTNNIINISYSLLKSNEERSFEIKVKVKSNSKLGTINNVAIVKVNDEEFDDDVDVKIVDTDLVIKKEIHDILNGKTFTSKPEDYEKTSGESFYYYITVKNNGTTDANNIQVVDNIPNYLEFISANVILAGEKIDYDITNNTFTVNINTLNTSDYVNIIIKVKVKKDIVIEGTIKNIVTLKEDGKPDKTDDVDITVKKPNLSIEKTVSEDTIKRGNTFIYTITIKNNGEGKALNVNVVDVIDSNFEITSVEGATIFDNVVSAKYETLEPSEEKTIKINIKVKSDSKLGIINNNAIVSGDNDETKESNVDVTIVDSDLKIEKYIFKNDIKDNNIVKPGETFKYFIIVTNTGTGPSANTKIYDEIPDEIKITAISGTRNNTNLDIPKINNNILDLDLGTINSGETITITIEAILNVDAKIGETIKNIAILKEEGQNDKDDDADLIVSDSDIYIIKTVDKKEYQVNDVITYTIKIYNSGNAIANNLKLSDKLDERLTFIEATSSKGNVLFATDTITLDIDMLDINEVITITLKAKVNSLAKLDDIINNKAILKVNDETLESDVDINIIDSDLIITKVANKNTLSNNEELMYVIKVKNNGKGIARNIKIVDALDSRLKLIIANNANIENEILTWHIEELKSKEEATFTILVKVNDDKEIDKINNKAVLKEPDKEDKESDVDVEIINKKEEIKEENPKTGGFINIFLVTAIFIVGIIILIISSKNRIFRKI